MGARGPQRDPNSIRGRREVERQRKVLGLASEANTPGVPSTDDRQTQARLPTCPKGLPARVEEIWKTLVLELVAANVPVLQVDSHAIEMAARCIDAVGVAGDIAREPKIDPKDRVNALRLEIAASSELSKWLDKIGGTVNARVRMGIKVPVEKKKGVLEQLMERKGQQ